ncbi:MAG: Rpn family recombination-promoting nuclease/putative transposase [Leptolyngbyaceae cyanobacterium bins.302]|nr:Rpn family recombination-promoting nuclease/putative transposase [Leptolyngbyaceae cyanobacterium bins.302]
MRRDAIFYQIFQRYPDLIFELIDRPLTPHQGYRFDSVEVKETSFRVDGVFLPPADANPKRVIFAEVQFQKDETLYHRFFTESLIYLYRNQGSYDDWYGVILFASRSLEPSDRQIHRSLLESDQVQRIYLDELSNLEQQPLGVSLIQLTTAPEATAPEQARALIQRSQTESLGNLAPGDIIELVATILFYKFSNLSREEVSTMLGLDKSLKETRVYRDLEAEAEAKFEARIVKAVQWLAEKGLPNEEIAEALDLSVERVQEIVQQAKNSD